MRYMLSILLLMMLTLTTSAEEITTGNLLPNAGDNASSAQSVDNNIPSVASSCGEFTVSNATCHSNEIETTGTGTVKATGSLLNITTNSDTTTQDKLNNGITLDSTTIVQNCEWDGSSNECGDRAGARDTFKTTVKILDSNGNTLASVDQIRNTDSHYYSNAHKYTDQVIYTGTGSNSFDWTWTGIDNNANPGNLGGPNLLGASLTMTYENVVLEVETQTALQEVNTAISAEKIQEAVSVIVKEETETLAAKVQTISTAPISKTNKIVQVQAAIKKFEEKTGAKVKKAKVSSQPTPKATTVKQPVAKKEKKATVIAKQIIQSTRKETKNEKEKEQKEQKPKEEKQEKQEEKKVVSKTTSSKSKATTKDTAIDTAMAKVDEVVKDIAKNLEVKNLIKLDAMQGDISLALYTNNEFYKSKDIYLDQNILIDNRNIYNNISLVSYIENDPVAQKEQVLYNLHLKEKELLIKLEKLNNG